MLFGGILTKYLGWEWIFFVNVPVGALVLLLTLRFVPESRAELGHRRFDAAGAVTITEQPHAAGLRDLEGARRRLGPGRTIGLLLASALLVGALDPHRDARSSAAHAARASSAIRSLLGATWSASCSAP